MNEKASRLHNDLSERYFPECNNLFFAKTKKMNPQKRDSKYKTKNLFLEDYGYDDWLKLYSTRDTRRSKRRKGINILT